MIVGAVPTGFSRGNYYKKELDLRMSSSYGPGRYDANYEEKGIDYPIGYVRFTENRNMQTFIELLSENKINLEELITHKFDLADSPKAYDLILERKEPVIGILLMYNNKEELQSTVRTKENHIDSSKAKNVGFIGAGNFAQSSVLPNLKEKCNFVGIVTGEGNSSRYIADKYKFNYCTDSPEDLLNDKNIGTIFVLTRHNTHADYVISSLKAGKNVIVEKPLAMTFDELENVKKAYEVSQQGLMLGFNRRFAPLTSKMLTNLINDQKIHQYRVNAGVVPPDHWVHDPEIGGGRIIGEVCHIIDLSGYIAGSKVRRVSAMTLKSNPSLSDSVSINIEYVNGSIANISYYSNGNKNVPKERIEVFCNGAVYLINDFKALEIINERGSKKFKNKGQDKGHAKEFELVANALSEGQQFPISFDEIYHSSFVTLETIRSIKEIRVIEING